SAPRPPPHLLSSPTRRSSDLGTPSPFSTSASSAGLLRIGVVNRLFGWAAFSLDCGVQSFPRQSVACAGGSPSLPSHHTSPSSVRSEEHTSELQSLTNLVCRLL